MLLHSRAQAESFCVNPQHLLSRVTAGLAMSMIVFIATAVHGEDMPDAQAILETVRLGAASREVSLSGKLREKDSELPFTLTSGNGEIRYKFENRPLELILRLEPERAVLLAAEDGAAAKPVDPARKLPVVDLDMGELALDFLYWNKAVIEREETITTQRCWLIRLNAPSRSERYSVVFVWVDQKSGALMRMDGYDWEGKLKRRFLVRSAQKSAIGWILKQMRIQEFDAAGATTNRIYLEINGEAKVP
jgi:hypothetical protein